MRTFAKAILPRPLQGLLWRLYCQLAAVRPPARDRISFAGDYPTWEAASQDCGGYEAPQILEKVRQSTLKVKRGEAAFERDGVVFEKPQYSWPLLASLLCAASENGGKLNVVDFGGSLGSIYFQHRRFFHHRPAVCWTVVEQPHFVDVGCREIAEGPLRFCASTHEAAERDNACILLLSGVLQCLADPHGTLRELLSHNWSHVILDRTAFVTSRSNDRLTVQTVPASVYEAKYPSWFLSEGPLLKRLCVNYEVVAEWPALDSFPLEGDSTAYKGFFCRRRAEPSRATPLILA